jgi:ribosome-binding factor A
MPGSRRYPRVARVNEVLREVLAEAIERMADADERLAMLTVTAVKADPDLRQAKVLFDSLSDQALEALQDARPRLQGVIGQQVRLKWTPQLSFAADPAVQSGRRVEDILTQLRTSEEPAGPAGD